MRALPLVLIAVAACENPSALKSPWTATDHKGPVELASDQAEPGASPQTAALSARLDKVEADLSRVLGILEKSPAAASSPAAFNAARIDRMEQHLDKVVEILRQAMPPTEPDENGMYAVPVAAIDPVQGPKDAKVTIVEGFEFLCPYCFQVNPTVDQILAKYPNDVRLVSKYLIIHGAPAVLPGMAACAASKQGKFKEMKAALWSTLFKMDNGHPARATDKLGMEDVDKLAAASGVDEAKLKADMASDECRSWIEQSQALMHPLGASATPAFFVNGRFLGGAQPFEQFDKLIQEELAKADKKIADGVKQADYYDKEVVAKGLKKVKGPLDD